MIKLHSFAVCALLFLSGSAMAQESSPAPVADAAIAAEPTAVVEADATAEAAVATPAAATTGTIGAPPDGKGQIVFFREKKFAGSAVRYKVREGETELGKLSSGVYFVQTVEPGPHQYTVHSEAKDILNLEVEPGETYYVQGTITMGIMVGHPNLSPSDEATFNGMSKKLKLAP